MDGRVSQVVAEVSRQGAASGYVSQALVEIARPNPQADSLVSQVIAEVARPNTDALGWTLFPPCVELGAASSPAWRTDLADNAGGWQSGEPLWTDVRHEFDVSLAIRTASDYQAVREHFHQMRGRVRTFGFRDFLDHTASAGEGLMTPHGDGFHWRLVKRYTSGASTYDRPITRPVEGKCFFFRTREGVVSAALDALVNWTRGTLAFALHEDGDAYSWTGEFVVPVRYAMDRLAAAIVDRQPQRGELLVHVEGVMLREVREVLT